MLTAADCIDVHLVRKKITTDHMTARDSGTQVDQTVVLPEEVEVQE